MKDPNFTAAEFCRLGTEKRTTLNTRACLWDINCPDERDEILEDAGLRAKLEGLASFWKCDPEEPNGKFVLITATGDSSRIRDGSPLQVRLDTLQFLVKTVGFCERATTRFMSTYIPTMSFHLQYDESDERPTSMTILFRVPRHSNSVNGMMRIQFSTLHCIAFINCCTQDDTDDIRTRCFTNADLLRTHPLYLLSIIFEQRYQRWASWFSNLWVEVLEIETLTNKTHQEWKMLSPDPERLLSLSNTDRLLSQLHATNCKLCHCRTVMTYAFKFGKFALATLAAVEKHRLDLGLRPIPARHRSGLQESIDAMVVRCDSVSDRLAELKERLTGQINVSYNLIAQKDTKVNLMVAKLQSHDSRTMKGIAVLGLVFLPSTLIATLWTTNLFQLDGDTNWQVFIVVSLLLTLMVLFCWGFYIRWSKKRQEEYWPERATIDTIHISPV